MAEAVPFLDVRPGVCGEVAEAVPVLAWPGTGVESGRVRSETLDLQGL